MANFKKQLAQLPTLTQAVMVSAILLEVVWAYCWMIWVSQWPSFNWSGTPLNFPSCLALALFAGLMTQLALRRAWSAQNIRWAVLPGSLLLLFLLMRLNNGGGFSLWDGTWTEYASSHLFQLVFAFMLGVYFCWRGISSNRQSLTFSDLYRKFVTGVVALVILLIIWALPNGDMPGSWSKIGVYLVLYFGVGLLSLALANLESLKNELMKHQEASAAFSRRWISILVILVLAILGISVAVMGIFSSDFVGTLLHGLGIAANWLITGVSYLLYPVGLLVAGLYYILQWLINWLRGGAEPPKFALPDFSDVQKQAEGQPTAHIPLIVLLLLKWGFLLLLMILLIFLLSRALTRFWQGKDLENVDEEHEGFFSWGLLRGDLASFFGWLFRWAKRKQKGNRESSGASSAARVVGEKERELNIRELYRALLRQGREIGSPRKSSETASEYEKRLEGLLPESKKELGPITESYVEARYGERIEEPQKLRLLNRLWQDLRLKLVRKA